MPKTLVLDDLNQFTPGNIAFPVTLSGPCQHGVWSSFDIAVDHPGEVDPQERKARIGNGIDESSDEMASLRPDLIVLSAKRNNLAGDGRSRHQRHTIGIKTGTVDHKPRPERALAGPEANAVRNDLDGLLPRDPGRPFPLRR